MRNPATILTALTRTRNWAKTALDNLLRFWEIPPPLLSRANRFSPRWNVWWLPCEFPDRRQRMHLLHPIVGPSGFAPPPLRPCSFAAALGTTFNRGRNLTIIPSTMSSPSGEKPTEREASPAI